MTALARWRQGLRGAFMSHLSARPTDRAGVAARPGPRGEDGGDDGDGAAAAPSKFVASKAVGWRRMRPHVKVWRACRRLMMGPGGVFDVPWRGD